MPVTTCAQCKAVLDEAPQTAPVSRWPCPNCGSLARSYHVLIQVNAEARGSLGQKARHGATGKPFLEQKSGDSFFHKAQRWVYRIMRIDRDNDLYSETVVDPATNEIIHRCEEPLSKHQGHGSAKRRND
mgnify:CR=1 FL=1